MKNYGMNWFQAYSTENAYKQYVVLRMFTLETHVNNACIQNSDLVKLISTQSSVLVVHISTQSSVLVLLISTQNTTEGSALN